MTTKITPALLLRRVQDLDMAIQRIATLCGTPTIKRASELRAKVGAEVAYAQSFKFPEETPS